MTAYLPPPGDAPNPSAQLRLDPDFEPVEGTPLCFINGEGALVRSTVVDAVVARLHTGEYVRMTPSALDAIRAAEPPPVTVDESRGAIDFEEGGWTLPKKQVGISGGMVNVHGKILEGPAFLYGRSTVLAWLTDGTEVVMRRDTWDARAWRTVTP